MTKSTIGSIQVIIASMFFGLIPLLSRVGYGGGANALTMLAIRFGLASLLLWGIMVTTSAIPQITLKQMLACALAGSLGYGLMTLSYFTSFKYIPSSMAAMILLTFPVLVTYLARIFLKTPITRVTVIALALVTIGGITMTWGQLSFNLIGILLALLTTVLYAAYIVFLGSSFMTAQNPRVLTGFILFFASVFCFGIGGLTGELSFRIAPIAWLAIIAMGTVTGLGMMVFNAGLQKSGPTVASILGNFEPITTFFAGLIILKEPGGITHWLGAGLILLGVLYLQLNGVFTKKEDPRIRKTTKLAC